MTEAPFAPAAEAPNREARMRSGTAARLAGLPVSTLRIWQRRYGVVAAERSDSGQRLYSMLDVHRLRLLRHLTGRGHAIGTVAALDLPALRALSADVEGGSPRDARVSGAPQLVVVGPTVVQRLHAAGVLVARAHDDLSQAEAAQGADSNNAAAPRLVVHLPSLQSASASRILALAERLQAKSVGVLYAFGPETVAESLRAAGVWVRREPVTGAELARLVNTRALSPAAAPLSIDVNVPSDAPTVEPRRFSDEQLMQLTSASTSVACECPRHVAELVTQLAGFERYSRECLSNGPRDEALHRHLGGLAGAARTLLERALARIIAQDGLPPGAQKF